MAKGVAVRITSCQAGVVTSLLLLGAPGHVLGQEVSEGRFFSSIDVRVASVEVVATDRQGRPVDDLQVGDFELLVDGAPVEITHFFSSSADTAPAAGELEEGESRPLRAEEPPPPFDQRLSLAIYVDDANVSPAGRRRALRELRDFLQEPLPEGLQMMLVTHAGTTLVRQPLTDDPAKLLSALDEISTGGAGSLYLEKRRLVSEMQNHAATQKGRDMGTLPRDGSLHPLELTGQSGFNEGGGTSVFHDDLARPAMAYMQQIKTFARFAVERNRASLAELTGFVRALSGSPGRKALLYVGDGLEATPGEDLMHIWEQTYPGVARAVTTNPTIEAMQFDMKEEVRDVIRFANGHRVTVFNLNTTGDRSLESVAADTKGFGGTAGFDSQLLHSSSDALVALAGSTGGRTLISRAGLGDQLEEVARDLGTYYSLGYVPPPGEPGAYHRIEVRVRRDGVSLSYPEGMLDRDAAEQATDRALAASWLGEEENPLGVSLDVIGEEPRDDGSSLVTLTIVIPLRRLALVPQGAAHEGRLRILLVVRDDSGWQSPVREHEFPISVANQELAAAMSESARFTMGLVMHPGPQRVAVSVLDELGAVSSSTTLEVDVGDGGDAAEVEQG